MSGGRAPGAAIGKCLSSSSSFVCLCRKNGSVSRRRIWAVGKKEGTWLASAEILWHMRQNKRPMLTVPHAKKMNCRRCWRCFSMPNYQLPMRNTHWCMNPARCSECHFTTHWARTSFSKTDNSFNEIHWWFLCLAAGQLLSLPWFINVSSVTREKSLTGNAAVIFSVHRLCARMLFYINNVYPSHLRCRAETQQIKWAAKQTET